MLGKDFSEFIASLNKRGVEYLVIGGYAVAFHGHPRYTKDIDLWVGNDQANVERLLLALADFGMGSLGLTADDFTRDGQMVQLGYPPNRIDLIVGLEAGVGDLVDIGLEDPDAGQVATIGDGADYGQQPSG